MPRRYRPERLEVVPDLRYNSRRVSMFVNRMMKHGKKSTALGIMYDSFDLMEERTKRNPLEVFEQAMQNATPAVEVVLLIRCRLRCLITGSRRWQSAGCYLRPAVGTAVQWPRSWQLNLWMLPIIKVRPSSVKTMLTGWQKQTAPLPITVIKNNFKNKIMREGVGV